MDRFNNLVAAAKTAQRNNCNEHKTNLAGGYAEDGEFCIVVSPVQGRISHLETVKISCRINGKTVSKAVMQQAMNG
jgi:hypothetical protein